MGVIIFDKESLKKAMDLLANGFEWESTPQGFNYWSEIMTHLCELVSFDIDPRPNDQNLNCGLEFARCLAYGFEWKSTPQGFNYWYGVLRNARALNNLNNLNQEDSYKDYDRAMGVI